MKKAFLIIKLLLTSLPALLKEKHVLVWIINAPCIIPIEKAFAFKRATEKGIKFSSAESFEKWYEGVLEVGYYIHTPGDRDALPQNTVAHFEGEPNILYWF
jgi:hypothetical protein